MSLSIRLVVTLVVVVVAATVEASSLRVPQSEEEVLKLPSQREPEPSVDIKPYAQYVAERGFSAAVKDPFLRWLTGRSGGVSNSVFTIYNNCPYTIWPAALTSGGGQISTGFELLSWHVATVNVPPRWSGRLWARFQCYWSSTGFRCNSADCGSGQIPCNGRGGATPATLAEFTLSGSGNQDFFDVSLVDGFNLPVRIQPDGCASASCPVDVNAQCPNELSIRDSNGGVIGCKSACLAFNQPRYCCTPPNNTPQTCPATSYSQFFKRLCPQAYSYAYDDASSTFTCPTGRSYTITWCP